MAIKTKAQLTTAFADNTSGAITPSDLRDFLDTCLGGYGGIKIENNSTGQVLVATTPEILTEWTANGIADGFTPDFANDKITVLNAGDYSVDFHASIDGITGATFHFHLYKNGSDIGPACKIKTANTDSQSSSFGDQLTLAANDVLTIWIESDANGTIVTNHANLKIKRIG